MSKPTLEVAEIFRRHAHDYPYPISGRQARVLQALQMCRTAHLGGHVERCNLCDHQRISYNSCRDRHCPKCQTLDKARWVEKHVAGLLPVPYFHLVFTIPPSVARVALQNPEIVYNILFQASSQALLTIGADHKHLGAQTGFLLVLHTWGQNLHHHPHVHCLIPGGGLSLDGEAWVASKADFFLPVRVLSRFFRERFLKLLKAAHADGALEFHGQLTGLKSDSRFADTLRQARRKEWVVYAKRPFGGPEQVVGYVGRYTHRVAISNNRLQSMGDDSVTFQWKDYRQPGVPKSMKISAHDFIRRFLMHVLPKGFVRLRHYGLLSNRNQSSKYQKCLELLQKPASEEVNSSDWKALYLRVTGKSIDACPACATGQMAVFEFIPSPQEHIDRLRPGIHREGSILSRTVGLRFLMKSTAFHGLQSTVGIDSS